DIRLAGREPLAGHVVQIDRQDDAAWMVELGIGLHQRAGDLSYPGDVHALGRAIDGAEERNAYGGIGERGCSDAEQTAKHHDEQRDLRASEHRSLLSHVKMRT